MDLGTVASIVAVALLAWAFFLELDDEVFSEAHSATLRASDNDTKDRT